MNKNLKVGLIVGVVILTILIAASFVLGGSPEGWHWHRHDMMWPGRIGVLTFVMAVIWIAVVGIIIWAVVTATKKPEKSDPSSHSEDSALKILKERYARGEIDREEFELKKKDLT